MIYPLNMKNTVETFVDELQSVFCVDTMLSIVCGNSLSMYMPKWICEGVKSHFNINNISAGIDGPRCPLSSKRLINLISLSLSAGIGIPIIEKGSVMAVFIMGINTSSLYSGNSYTDSTDRKAS